MRSLEIDARRYAWCHGQGLWIMGMPVAAFIEDMRGALPEGQEGLIRYAARETGEACAVVLALMLHSERPIPSPPMRTSWALERLGDDPRGRECWELVRADPAVPAESLIERCQRLVCEVNALVGELPDLLTPEGYFPALGVARDWLKLLDAVGEEDFLPREWTKGA